MENIYVNFYPYSSTIEYNIEDKTFVIANVHDDVGISYSHFVDKLIESGMTYPEECRDKINEIMDFIKIEECKWSSLRSSKL